MSGEEEKSLENTLKALPDLLRMEETYEVLATFVKQFGFPLHGIFS